MEAKDRQAPQHFAPSDAVAVQEGREAQTDHDLVVELLKVFATLVVVGNEGLRD